MLSDWSNVGGVIIDVVCYFFFSSRRRHTRFDCDWSSDVCSSDLISPATSRRASIRSCLASASRCCRSAECQMMKPTAPRSEEHTSELQSQSNLVCRLLLEKKKKKDICLNQMQGYCHVVTVVARYL